MIAGMIAQRWQTLKHIFSEAAELSEPARTTYLEWTCRGDEGLIQEVRSLLLAADRESPLDMRIDAVSAAIADADSDEPAGTFVGSYHILRELGHGGMGAVYLAERSDGQFRQTAALKLLRPGYASIESERRFHAERSILASLNHDTIARLYDGGMTADGRPYFAMEYVEGEPVDVYCNANRLPIRQRLELFLTVCTAVQYAHRKLVVHRDIKPSNILVTGEGRVKLLDFGIAKLTDGDSGRDGPPETLTRPGLLPLTPAYASPEQIRGETITASSDIYQLGVVLYELLTGFRPAETEGLSPAAVERAVCETEPIRPSERVRTLGGRDSERLSRQLRGDLDLVVLKALQKEPSRRYSSADQLSADVARYLSGQPVAAHPDSWMYRTRKFVRRRRIALSVASVVMLALSVGMAGTAWQARVAGQERDRARVEAEKARSVSLFLTDLFRIADPGETQGIEITARQVLEQGARRVRSELAGQPEVQAEMLYVLGSVYRQMGMYDRALELVLESLAIRREIFKPADPVLAQTAHFAGVLYGLAGKLDAAEAYLTEAMDARIRLYGADHPDYAESLHGLAQLRNSRGDPAAAESLFVHSLEIRRRSLGEVHESVGSALSELGVLKREAGDFSEAEEYLQRALEIHRSAFGDVHQRVAASLNELATLMVRKGDLDAAEPLYRESLELSILLYGSEHPRVITGLHNLGRLLGERRELHAADSLLAEALVLAERVHGRRHPVYAVILSSRSTALLRLNDLDAAEALARESLMLRREIYGSDNVSHINTGMSNLALVLSAKGEAQEAIELFREVADNHRSVSAVRKSDLATVLNNLGTVLHANAEYAAAVPVLEEALELRRQLLPEGHWRIADVEATMGACLSALGRYREAEMLLTDSYRIVAAQFGSGDRNARRIAGYLVNHYTMQLRPDAADRYRVLAEVQ
jgi:eukaryotic-like serine/threonine-protein kinase